MSPSHSWGARGPKEETNLIMPVLIIRVRHIRNMMDDVLISNCELQCPGSAHCDAPPGPDHKANSLTTSPVRPVPPVLLRSALRALVSQGAATQRPFVEHIRTRLLESPPVFTDAAVLFPSGSDGLVSPECLRYTAATRCIFSSKLAKEALP